MSWKEQIPASFVKWGLIALLAVCALAYLRFAPDSMKPWTNKPEPAQQAQEPKPVAKIKRKVLPTPVSVTIIDKPEYMLKMPDVLTPSTVQDNAAHVIASATIPPSVAGGTASAILRVQDGVGTGSIEYRPATPPFFAIQKEFGVRGGVGTGGLVLGELYARPVRVGPIAVEIRAYGMRNDRSGADFGAVILGDMRF